MAVGLIWSLTARVTHVLDPGRPAVQLLVIAIMVGALVLSAAVPEAFGRTGLIFAVTYLVLQAGRSVLLAILLRGHQLQHAFERGAIWHAGTGVVLVIGALFPDIARTVVWSLAVGVIYLARKFNYPVPGLRQLAGAGLPPGGEYLAERHRALFVIGLGEVVLAIGSSLTSRGFATGQTVAFVLTFVVTALIWRIYIFRAGEEIGLAIEASANPDRLSVLVYYAHLIMIAGIVVISAGDELVIQSPFGHPRAGVTVTLLGGPALFIVGRILLQYLVFDRISRSRTLGLLALACLVAPMLFLPPLASALATGTVLGGIVIADNRRIRRHPAPVFPPGPHRDSHM
jgi:low temperature requirement protein LtrA